MNAPRRVGIVGYGALGRHLAGRILDDPELAGRLALEWVWNRNPERIGPEIPKHRRLARLEDFPRTDADLVVEVAQSEIVRRFGCAFLERADTMAGSPAALADPGLEREVAATLARVGPERTLYIPRGALPGLEEIVELARTGRLAEVRITMEKHPASLAWSGPASRPVEAIDERTVLHEGPLRPLCAWAPRNVNTMAALALASGLGFDRVHATLVADPALEHHVTRVQLVGPDQGGARFSLEMIRRNPATPGALTGQATFRSFARSLSRTYEERPGGLVVI